MPAVVIRCRLNQAEQDLFGLRVRKIGVRGDREPGYLGVPLGVYSSEGAIVLVVGMGRAQETLLVSVKRTRR
jgi:hypothetical protein